MLVFKMFLQNNYSRFFVLIASLFLSFSMHAQVIIVKGSVVDESGTPLLGATIIVDGPSNGAPTDFDGNYLLNVKTDNAMLVFSYLGFAPQKLPLASPTVVTVLLA